MSDEFLVRFPCYVPVKGPFQFHPGTTQVIVDGTNDYVVCQIVADIFILGFTDMHLGEQFLNELRSGKQEALLLTVPDSYTLGCLVYGIKVQRSAEVGVLFDRSPTHPGWPVAYSVIASPDLLRPE